MTEALWYTARGTGVVSLLLLTIVVVLGIGSRAGRPVFGLPRFAVSLVHRNASLMATVLIAIHVSTLLTDPYAHLKLLDLIVPFDATYRPAWVGLGTTVLDLVIAIVVTSLLRRRLGARTWRAVHWFAFAMWPIAWLHGIGSGTDRGSAWYLALAVAAAITVAAALVWRLSPSFATIGGRREPHTTSVPTPTFRIPTPINRIPTPINRIPAPINRIPTPIKREGTQ
jgi:methionine sulfoxide reductase heme-binding subunit